VLDFRYPNTSAERRGWGPGWPDCQASKMVLVGYPSFNDTARIRVEVHALLLMLLETTEDRGYKLDGPVTDDWAYVCRATKRADGTFTTTPSNHSWGLAVDLNATRNVYGGGHDMPAWVPELWKDYGWRWLGPPIEDWAHLDFCGTPADAKALTLKAEGELMKDPRVDEMLAALTDFNRGNAKDDQAGGAYDKVFAALRKAASQPVGGGGFTKDAADALYAPKTHPHDVVGKTR
jgi:D-alanyl-D-alanine carboxypeptidase